MTVPSLSKTNIWHALKLAIVCTGGDPSLRSVPVQGPFGALNSGADQQEEVGRPRLRQLPAKRIGISDQPSTRSAVLYPAAQLSRHRALSWRQKG